MSQSPRDALCLSRTESNESLGSKPRAPGCVSPGRSLGWASEKEGPSPTQPPVATAQEGRQPRILSNPPRQGSVSSPLGVTRKQPRRSSTRSRLEAHRIRCSVLSSTKEWKDVARHSSCSCVKPWEGGAEQGRDFGLKMKFSRRSTYKGGRTKPRTAGLGWGSQLGGPLPSPTAGANAIFF